MSAKSIRVVGRVPIWNYRHTPNQLIARRRQHRTGPTGAEPRMTGCHTQTLVIRGAQPVICLSIPNTSAQQRRAACSQQRRRRMSALPLPSPHGDCGAKDDEAGRPRPKGARPIVNETKALVVVVMGEFGRPMTSAELYAIWDGTKPLQAIEYHLSTLVKAKVAEVVFDPELHFQLVPVSKDAGGHFEERCR